MSETVQLQIPPPPNDIFLQENRSVSTGEKSYIHIRDRIEYTEDKGIQEYVIGGKFPRKGFPTPPAIYALNQTKRVITEFISFLSNPFLVIGILVTDKNVFLARFNRIFDRLFVVHKLKEVYLCPAAKGFMRFVCGVLKDLSIDETIAYEFAFNVCHILQYDDAYRYRVQDMMTEANISALQKAPIGEIKRLIGLWGERDLEGVTEKMKKLVTPLLLVLYIPKYRRAFTSNVHHIQEMKRDEADWYWVCLRSDYNYAGMTYEERMTGITEPTAYEING